MGTDRSHRPDQQASKQQADASQDPEHQEEVRESRQTGGDAPAAGSIAEREAVAEGGGAFGDGEAAEQDEADAGEPG